MQGHVIAGKYALLKKIAFGGMAEVFLAKQLGMDGFEKLVVLKRILPHLADNSDFIRMFLDEARTAADLRHAHIAHTFEVGEDRGVYFMVMEFLHGQDLRSIFRSVQALGQGLPLQHAVGIVMDAASGIHYAHTKCDLYGKALEIIHRDISPQNIVVTYAGETKIVDFGIAKAAHQSQETMSGILKGKYAYMSPEQAQGHELDARSDQFSLGIILYELSTMRRLFKYDNEMMTLKAIIEAKVKEPKSIIDEYPSRLNEIVMRTLSPRREDRYADCEALRKDLEGFLESLSLQHTSSRLCAYMRSCFKERIVQEESLAKGALDIENAMEQLWPSADSMTKSDVLLQKSASQTDNSILWQRTQIGMMSLLGGALGFICVAVIWAFFSYQQESSNLVYSEDEKRISALEALSIKEIFLRKKESKESFEVPESVLPKGRLKIVVEPWAEVFIDGKSVGTTPMGATELELGHHHVRLVNPELKKSVVKDVVVKSKQDTLVRHKW